MRIESDPKLDFEDVLIRPKRSTLSSRKQVDLIRSFKMKWGGPVWEGIPIVAANMDTIGTFEMAKTFSRNDMVVALDKHYSADQYIIFFKENHLLYDNVFYSMGVSKTDLEKFKKVKTELGLFPFKNICIDVANGYSEYFTTFVKSMRDENPEVRIMAGNVVTAEMTEELILSGADIVKVGIGPGSVCTTRKMTGVGYPQLSAIIECADAAHGLGGLICADGGIKVPGDFGKAFGAGADFVMCGGIFAGHDECGGEVIDGKMKFYGMSSDTAMNKHSGGVADYRTSEGRTVEVPYKGPVENTIKEILGGLRSTCTYVGATKLKELCKRTTFVMVNRQLNNKFSDS